MIFSRLPDSFFTPLASPNGHHYAALLEARHPTPVQSQQLMRATDAVVQKVTGRSFSESRCLKRSFPEVSLALLGSIRLKRSSIDSHSEIFTLPAETVGLIESVDVSGSAVLSVENKESHFGDLDADGLLILHEMERTVGEPVVPFGMSGAVYRRFLPYGFALSDARLDRLGATRDALSAASRELADCILEHRKGVEQEVVGLEDLF